MNIEVLVIPGCPHAPPAVARVREVVDALAPGTPVHEVVVANDAQAEATSFPGSPTVRIDGRDVEPVDTKPAISCRFYTNRQGVPDRWRIEAGLLRALQPKHILFLCVANSARSQLAEGIARRLAPEGVIVSSAGSVPTQVRAQAIEVLGEIGIDISAHRSKAVHDIDPSSVDAVITLCAEEVCPAFLGKAWRAHWGLPDPAAAQGDDRAVLGAFRATRDELEMRLGVLFGREDRA